MGLELGGLLGAVTQASTAASGEKSLKSFLNSINSFGVQVTNNFEVNFSGLQDITFFVQSVSVPGMDLNTTEIFYDGRKIEVPVNYDWQHDFSINVINDAQGYIYAAITNFLMSDATADLVDSGYTMTLKALTGDSSYKGSLYTFYGVKLVNVGNLNYQYEGGDKSTFDVNLKCNYYTATPGALGSTAGILGAVNSLIS